MAKPLTVSVPHSLGKAEAIRRLQQGTALLRERYADHITVLEDTWTNDHLDFQVAALGQKMSGQIDVADDAVQLAVELPALLHLAGSKIKALVEKQGALLLEKK